MTPGHVQQYYWSDSPQTITVHDPEGPRRTGILDRFGNEIVSVDEIGPIGFNR
jgi:hypothetical protein